MSDIEETKPSGTVAEAVQEEPVRVLLLDDDIRQPAAALHHPAQVWICHRDRQHHRRSRGDARPHRHRRARLPSRSRTIRHARWPPISANAGRRSPSSSSPPPSSDALAESKTCICSRATAPSTIWSPHFAPLRPNAAASPSSWMRATSSTPASTWRWATTLSSRSSTPTATGST